jgi:putative transposase
MEHHMAIEKDLLDQLLAGRDPKDVFNKDGLVDELKKALSERILNTELDEHLDSDGAEGKSNHRNGYSKKSVLTGTSKMTLSVPRDRAGTFDPKLIAKYQRRFPDFDDKIISMYARGMSVREIRGHLEELYGIDVSPDLISAITDAVLEEVAEWQSRPLDICYPLVFFDAIRVKVRRLRAQQGDLYCAGSAAGRHQRDSRHLDRTNRGRQILATRRERTEDPWGPGHSNRRRRWPEGFPRGH